MGAKKTLKPPKGANTEPVRRPAGQKPKKKGTEVFGKWQGGKPASRVTYT